MGSAYVISLAVCGTSLVAGTSNVGGVFASTNNGAMWTPFNTGLPSNEDLPSTTVWSLAVIDTFVFAGTSNNGVWRRTLSQLISSAPTSSTTLPAISLLAQNFPNPFNPSTTIKYELRQAVHVKLTVYDILSREVSVLVNDGRDAGVHEVNFDGSNLASGVYFYRLQAGDYVATKRLLLLK
jgi:hypothetical protein